MARLKFVKCLEAKNQIRTLPGAARIIGGDAVADGKLADIRILQIRDALVEAVAFETSQIVPADERLVGLNLKLRLKRVGLIADLVRRRRSPIDEKHRN